jgi:hypothetical protein
MIDCSKCGGGSGKNCGGCGGGGSVCSGSGLSTGGRTTALNNSTGLITDLGGRPLFFFDRRR